MPLDFLTEGHEPSEPAVTPEPALEPEPQSEPAAAEPQPEAQPRGPDGRFAPVDGGTERAEPNTPPPGYVPTTALQAERERRQAVEEQLRQYQAQEPAPDFWADPEGFAAQQQQLVAEATLKVKLDLSEDMARSKYGDESVTAAQEWAQSRFAQSPAYQQEVLSQRNPYEFVLQAYTREQAVAGLSNEELAEFRQWRQTRQPANPLAASPPSSTPVKPPPESIATATPAGGAAHVPSGPGHAYDGLFKRS